MTNDNVYIPRTIDKELLKWKEDRRHKPLLIRGARQVGKSSAVRHLAKSFKYFVELNLERDKNLKKIFEGDLSPQRICRDLSVLVSTPIIPGETLLFIDEIQGSKEAISSLRFFYEDYQQLHVIAAGSLLEFALKDLQSFGVGRIRSLFMYPFSFNEFLEAQNLTGLLEAKKNASPENPLTEPLHDKLVEQIRYFHLVGGMPAAVSLWCQTHNYQECRDVHNDIVQSYMDDFSKYGSKVNPQLLRNVMNVIAANVCAKFKYASVANYDSRQVKEALQLLTMAGVIIPVTHTSANGQPLGADANEKFRKFIFLDTALLLRLHHLKVEDFLLSEPMEFVNKGSLAEMFVGLELLKYDNPYEWQRLYYWQREEPKSQAEVDYVIIRHGDIIPLEVKAGKRGSMQSLYLFLEKKGASYGIRCALEPYSTYEKIRVYPLYAVSEI